MAKILKRYIIRPSKTELGKPRRIVEENLLARSRATDFEEARLLEWSVVTLIDHTSQDFSSRCELCHTTGLKYNFIVQNEVTGYTLRVGTTCILRFGVGTKDMAVESRAAYLQNIADEKYLKNIIQTHVKDVMVLYPERSLLRRFYESLKKYMDLRGIQQPSDEQLGELMFGSHWKNQNVFYLNRMKALFYTPGIIETVQKKKVQYQANPKEGEIWYKKRRRVQTSLASSEVYQTERFVVESNQRNK